MSPLSFKGFQFYIKLAISATERDHIQQTCADTHSYFRLASEHVRSHGIRIRSSDLVQQIDSQWHGPHLPLSFRFGAMSLAINQSNRNIHKYQNWIKRIKDTSGFVLDFKRKQFRLRRKGVPALKVPIHPALSANILNLMKTKTFFMENNAELFLYQQEILLLYNGQWIAKDTSCQVQQ